MEATGFHPEYYSHVRIIMGMVVGLSVARILNRLARFVQHPNRDDIYSVHIAWSFFLILAVVHFWWFEFRFSWLDRWTFAVYFFLILYACIYFFLAALLDPDELHDYEDFETYFHSRQKWFFSLLALLFVIDVIDTNLKGADYFRSLGPIYPLRQAMLAAGAVAAVWIRSRTYHMIYVGFALILEVIWAIYHFDSWI
ncbi:hypothetical protein [Amorphus orientalis]|uniref:Uncharacterized protein n=1 Tax=Amorphus orientalis TaxID=649198 RepID=A0AAE3VL82_9HYPH|nr:hypothetical protein [Amorphus orientalis]MDQ0313973.1 hypothetical protein [Amorphus orientalis]